MAHNLVAPERDQLCLLPPSLTDWLSEEHLAFFVLDEDQVIVAAEVTDECNDAHQLHPMIEATKSSPADVGIEERPDELLAEAGYTNEENFDAIDGGDPDCYVATRNKKSNPTSPRGMRRPLRNDATSVEKMDRKVSHKAGRELYRPPPARRCLAMRSSAMWKPHPPKKSAVSASGSRWTTSLVTLATSAGTMLVPSSWRRRTHTTSHPDLVYSGAVATEQIAVRLPQELLEELDQLVARGVYESRAAAVRAGVEAVAESERRRGVDRAVIEGYRRTPASEAEREAAIASLRDAIAEEPW